MASAAAEKCARFSQLRLPSPASQPTTPRGRGDAVAKVARLRGPCRRPQSWLQLINQWQQVRLKLGARRASPATKHQRDVTHEE